MIFNKKPGLLLKVLISIFLGILFSFFSPDWFVRVFVTLNALFGNFLSFVIPLLILGLIAPGIADLGKGAGKLLIITVAIAYGSTIFSGFFSYFTTKWSLPFIIESNSSISNSGFEFTDTLLPFFKLEMTPLMGVTTALILAFILGIGISSINGEKLKVAMSEFRDIILLIIKGVIIPLLPFYIFGIFLKIGAEGQMSMIINLFFKLILVIFIMHILLLLFQFTLAGIISKKNPIKSLLTMMPAYVTALGTQSSAATIPVTLIQAKKNGVKEDIADFVIPLCATIHLAGSTLKIVSCAVAVMYMTGLPTGPDLFSGFIMMLGITMVAAPGVPGGAIMAAIAILQSMLGFDETLTGLMVALYITMDSFGTACNVTGDGAIALVVNRISSSSATLKQ